MKFSLQDLLWSVTLASVAAAAASVNFGGVNLGAGKNDVVWKVIFLFMIGPFLGAAIGKLFHRTIAGFLFGFIGQFFVYGLAASIQEWILFSD